MNIITSKSNDKIKKLKKLRDNSNYRKETNQIFLEGERLINDTPVELIKEIYLSKDYIGKIPNSFDRNSKNVYILEEEVYKTVCDTVNSKGIIAVAENKKFFVDDILLDNNNLILLLNGIKDPGNMGTIIRTAEAASVSGIILDTECVDYTSPKVTRSSMSSLFRMKIAISDSLEDTIKYLKLKSISMYATSLENAIDYTKVKFNNNLALVIGSESKGIDGNVLALCDNKIKILMDGEIESLNAAIATAIILFEIKRNK